MSERPDGSAVTERLKEIFMTYLKPASGEDVTASDFVRGHVQSWDSVGHLALVGGIEEAFGISLDVEDVLAVTTFEEAVTVLRAHGVTGEEAVR